ncbi:RING/U-box superfamily protein [Euphorbia peplus]|nr:RING/U-box superfamily protein [Euphorbia peplus]
MGVVYLMLSILKTPLILLMSLLLKIIIIFESFVNTISGCGHRILTTSQFMSYIEDTIPAIRYTSTCGETKECAVCLCELSEDESIIRELKCEHMFHKECLDKWLLQCRSNCPLCRSMVLPDKVVPSYRLRKDHERVCDVNNEEQEEIVFLLFPSQGY